MKSGPTTVVALICTRYSIVFSAVPVIGRAAAWYGTNMLQYKQYLCSRTCRKKTRRATSGPGLRRQTNVLVITVRPLPPCNKLCERCHGAMVASASTVVPVRIVRTGCVIRTRTVVLNQYSMYRYVYYVLAASPGPEQ